MAKLATIIIQIRHQVDAIEAWVKGRTIADFKGDMLLRNAIERSIEIISEASRRIPQIEKAKHPQIPWNDIADVGNFIRHQYHDINDKILWDLTQESHLRDLKAAVNTMNPNATLPRRRKPSADS
ncbi:MAG: DUF86 domain-containing protein [Hyphomicrobiaceae bacterium]